MERTILSSIILAGSYAGAAVGLPLSGILADHIAWNAPFYVYGLAGLIWSALWLWLSSEKPSNHSSISASEKSHIEDSLADSYAEAPTGSTLRREWELPWFRLLLSLPVQAIIFANFVRGWTSYLLMVMSHRFLKESFDMRSGLLSNLLPHLVMTIVVPLSGLLADLLRMKKSSQHNHREEDLRLWRFWRGGRIPLAYSLCWKLHTCHSGDRSCPC